MARKDQTRSRSAHDAQATADNLQWMADATGGQTAPTEQVAAPEPIPMAGYAPTAPPPQQHYPTAGYPPQGYAPPGYPPPGYAPPGYPPAHGYPSPGYGHPAGYDPRYAQQPYAQPPQYAAYPPGAMPPYGMPYPPRAVAAPSGRLPGNLITIGVISILWGLLTVILNVLAISTLETAYRKSIPPPPPPPPPPPVVQPIEQAKVTPYNGDVVGEQGFAPETRLIVTNAVREKLKLSADRAAMLEWFLADVGQGIFGQTPANAAAVNALVTKWESAATSKDPEGPDVFTTAQGRVEISDAHVHFESQSAGTTKLEGTVLTPPNGQPRWSSRALKAAAERLRPMPGREAEALSPEQVGVLLKYMAAVPVEHMRNRGDMNFRSVPTDRLIISLPGRDQPYLSFHADGQRHQVFPDGRDTYDPNYGRAARSSYALPQTPPFRPELPGSLTIIRLLPYEAWGNAIQGVCLLIAGIMTVAGIPGAARLHRLWAYLRLLLGVASVAMVMIYIQSLPREASAIMTGTLFGVVFAMLYPVAVLLVLRSQSARQYLAFHQRTDSLVPQSMLSRWRELIARPLGRMILLSVAIIGGVACAMHMSVITGKAADATKVAHVGYLALAAGAMAFGAVHFLASLGERGSKTTVSSTFALLALLLAGSAGAAPASQPAAVPEAEQVARARAVIQEIQQSNKPMENAEYTRVMKTMQDMLASGPHAERIAFESYPKVSRRDQMKLLAAFVHYYSYGKRSIASEAEPAALAAVPALVDAFNGAFVRSSQPGAVLAKVLAIKGAPPVVTKALVAANCPGDRMKELLKAPEAANAGGKTTGGPAAPPAAPPVRTPPGAPAVASGPASAGGAPASSADVLKAVLSDTNATSERRRQAVTALAGMGDEGMQVVRALADGTHPAVEVTNQPFNRSNADRKEELRYRDQMSLRQAALGALTPSNRAQERDAATLAALKTAMQCPNPEIRRDALHGMQRSGKAGLQTLIDCFRDEAPAEQLRDVAREISNAVSYPHSLNDEPGFTSEEHRKAAAKLMGLLLEYYEPGYGMKNMERATEPVMKLVDGEDAELARQATTLVFYSREISQALGAQRLTALYDHKSSTVADAAMKSALNRQNIPRQVPDEILVRTLSSTDGELRTMAAERLFGDSRRKLDRSLVMRLLDAPDRSVQREAARYLRSNDKFRSSLGPITFKRTDTIMGWTQSQGVPTVAAERIPWPRQPAAPPAAPKPTAVTPPPPAAATPAPPPEPGAWPTAYVTLAALAGILALCIATLFIRSGGTASSEAVKP